MEIDRDVDVDDNLLVAAGVVAAADDPPETTIEPHLEMSYNKEMPGEISVFTRTVRAERCAGKILFYCSEAPSCGGGQTPICDMRKVYSDIEIHRDSLGHLLDNGVRYCRSVYICTNISH